MFKKVICFLLLALSVGAVPKGSLTGASQVIIPQSGVDYSSFNLASNVLGSLARDAEIITPTDAPDYGLTSYTNQPYMLFFLGDYVIIKGEIIPLTAYSFPDMAVTEPTTNYPVSFAAFAPTVTNRTPYVGSPEIAEWTRQNDPGDTMALTGEALEDDFAGFYYYSEDAAGFGDIQRLDGQQAAVTLPSTLTADDFNLMWPLNKNGFGYPVGINKTEAWKLIPNVATTGQTVTVYGENLELGDDGLTQLYIDGYGWVTNQVANPYKAEFIIPSLAEGSYTGTVHNGHGQKYGWSDDITFDVEYTPWDEDTNNWVNILDIDPNAGDGSTDAMVALTTAMSTCPDWGTIYLPDGTYAMETKYNGFRANVRFVGESKTGTIIINSPDFETTSGSVPIFKFNRDYLQFKSLTLAVQDGVYYNIGSYPYEFLTSENVAFDDVLITTSPMSTWGETIKFDRTINTRFDDCEFVISRPLYFTAHENVQIVDSDFYAIYDANGLVGSASNGQGFTIEGCTVNNYAVIDSSYPRGYGKGRFVSLDHSDNVYYGNNAISNYQPRIEYPFYTNDTITALGEFGTPYVHTGTGALGTVLDWTVTFSDIDDYLDGLGSPSIDYAGVKAFWPRDGGGRMTSYMKDLDAIGNQMTVMIKENQFSYTNDITVAATTNVVLNIIVDQNAGEMIMGENNGASLALDVVSATSNTVTFSTSTTDSSVFIADGRGYGQTRNIISWDSNTATLDKDWRITPDSTSDAILGRSMNNVAVYDSYFEARSQTNNTASTTFKVQGSASRMLMDSCTGTLNESGFEFISYSKAQTAGNLAYACPVTFGVIKNSSFLNNIDGMRWQVTADEPTDATDYTTVLGSIIRGNTFSNNVDAVSHSKKAGFNDHSGVNVYDGNTYLASENITDEGATNFTSMIFVDNAFTGTGVGFYYTSAYYLNNALTSYGTNFVNSVGAQLQIPQSVFPTNTQTVTVYNMGDVAMPWITSTGSAGTNAAQSTGTFDFTATESTNITVIGGGDTNIVYFEADLPGSTSSGPVNLLSNGDFTDGLTSWTIDDGGWSVTNGTDLVMEPDGGNCIIWQEFGAEVGKEYYIRYTVTDSAALTQAKCTLSSLGCFGSQNAWFDLTAGTHTTNFPAVSVSAKDFRLAIISPSLAAELIIDEIIIWEKTD